VVEAWGAGSAAGALGAESVDVELELELELELAGVGAAGWSDATSDASRRLDRLAVEGDALDDGALGTATGGGVPEAAADGGWATEAGTLGVGAGIGGVGAAVSVTTGALASALASAVADLDRCRLGAGSP
jgi:hypothetical protein